jgi:ABC-2 type transport system permease protein
VAGDTLPQPTDLLLRQVVALAVGLVLLVLSHRVFLRLQGNFAQEL